MSKIFIGNLPNDVQREDLEEFFSRFGPIVNVSIKHLQHPPPFGFVEFENPRDADAAVREKHNTEFQGKVIRVEMSVNRRERNDSRRKPRSQYRVRVSNLPSSVSWQDLKDIMRDFGEVSYTDVDRRGGGVAEFSRRDDMEYCLEKLDDTQIQGNIVRVDPDGGGRGRSRSPPRRRRRSPVRRGGRSSSRGRGNGRPRGRYNDRRNDRRDDRRDYRRDYRDDRRDGRGEDRRDARRDDDRRDDRREDRRDDRREDRRDDRPNDEPSRRDEDDRRDDRRDDRDDRPNDEPAMNGSADHDKQENGEEK